LATKEEEEEEEFGSQLAGLQRSNWKAVPTNTTSYKPGTESLQH